MTPFMSSSVAVALPEIERELSLSAVSMSWVAGAYLLSAAAFLLPFGRLADIRGRKRIFLLGLLVHSLSSILTVAATGAGLLISARALQGIGGGMIFGTGVAILVSAFPPERRGRMLGLNVAAVYIGLSLGPFCGGILTHAFGWRSIFIAAAGIGAVTIAITVKMLKTEWTEALGESFDLVGSFVYCAALTALMLGFTALPGFTGAVLITIGTLLLIGFLVIESRMNNALLDVSLLVRNRVFAFSNLAALINYSATFAVTFLMSLYLQHVRGFDPTEAGIILASQPVVMAIFSPIAGRISDRIEPRIVASAGMLIIAIGLSFFTFVTEITGITTLISLLALLGFGFALFSSPNTNAVMSSVERKSYGVASSTLGTMRLSGQMLSMGVVILVFGSKLGNARITPRQHVPFMDGLHALFVIFTVLSLIGVFASMVRGDMKRG